MTVKELKNALKGISEPIDRIAGFCDNYEQMFESCQINVLEHAVQIDTIEDLFEPDSTPTIPEAIAEILALPKDLDNYIVAYEGEDNNAEHRLINRVIRKIAVIRGATGIGISLQGPQPSGVLNQHGYLTKLFVNDERAKSLNEVFYDFLDELDFTCDFMDSRETDEGIFIDFAAPRLPATRGKSAGLPTTMRAAIGPSVQLSLRPLTTEGALPKIGIISIASKIWSMTRKSATLSKRLSSSSPNITQMRNWATSSYASLASTLTTLSISS